MQLPIDQIRAEFETALQQGPVVVSAPTGSGKSTQVPRWCRRMGRVLVVEPRRVACRSLAVRVADLEGTRLGDGVGYTVRDDRRVSAKTEVVFATPGIVLRMLANATGGALQGFDTVIIDELHERQLDVDLICALAREHHQGRFCVMSATVQGDRIAAHLGGRHVQGTGRTFPVTHHYLPQGTLLPTTRGLEARVRAAVQAARDVPGDILVFLPGKAEIAACASALRDPELDVLPLHGGLTLDEQSRIFAGHQKRRVILATNVAETSLTIPGIGVVIDSGLVRQTRYFNGRGYLMLVPIADDSAEQRAGRAGRMQAGACFRLWDAAARLDAVTPPEIFRESLVPLVLAAGSCRADIDTLPFLDAPKPHALEAARSELRALGALTAENTLTERGQRLFGLPIDTHLGRLLVEAEGHAAFGDVVDLVAALAVDRPLFIRSRDWEDEEDLRTAGCDATALVRAVREGQPLRHGLSGYALREARATARRLRKAFGLPAQSGAQPDPDALVELAVRADPRCVHVKRERKRQIAWSNGGTEIELNSRSAVDPAAVDAMVVFTTRALVVKQRDTIIVATCAAPIARRRMLGLGLGRDRLAHITMEEGRLVATVERIFAKRVIGTRQESPQGPIARQAVCEMVLRGSLFKGARQAIEDRLGAAALYLKLVAARRMEPSADWALDSAWSSVDTIAEPNPWLLERLGALGLESGEDIALLTRDDLLPPPLPAALLEVLDKRFPRTLSLGDREYRLQYDTTSRWVTLHQTRGDSKSMPPLQYLPALSGFGLKVEKRGKVRVLRERR